MTATCSGAYGSRFPLTLTLPKPEMLLNLAPVNFETGRYVYDRRT